MDDPFELPPDVLRRVPLFAELSKVLSWTAGPVNWDLASQLAVSVAAGEGRVETFDGNDHAEVAEHFRIAELWLGETAGLPTPSHVASARAASAADWAEHAVGAYRELIDPIAAKAARALDTGAPEGPAAMLAGAMGQIAPMFMGIQVGTVLGTLAREVTGDHDVALPASESDGLLVLAAIDRVADEYQLDKRHARQWIALNEVARRMTYDGFAGVRAHFFALYHNFVASLDIDLARGIERLQQIDISDPERLQEAMADQGLFAPEPSAQTEAAAAAVTSFLSIVDAHNAAAVAEAAARAGDPGPVGEAFRRRAATDAKGAQMFQQFVGLGAPPASRTASAFVRTVLRQGGWSILNRMFEEPQALPTANELDEPDSWLRRVSA